MDIMLSVKSIKNLLLNELNDHKGAFFKAYPQIILSDVQKEIISVGYNSLREMLEGCQTHEELGEYITHAGYRMSLQEWADSL